MASAPSHAAQDHAGAVELLAGIPAAVASVLFSALALLAAVFGQGRPASVFLTVATAVGLLLWALGRRSCYATRDRIAVGFSVGFSIPPVLGLIAMFLTWLTT